MSEESKQLVTVIRDNQPELCPGQLIAEGIRFTYTKHNRVTRSFEHLGEFGKRCVNLLKKIGYNASEDQTSLTLLLTENKRFSAQHKSQWYPLGAQISKSLGYSKPSSERCDTYISVYLIYRHIDSDVSENLLISRMKSHSIDRVAITWGQLCVMREYASTSTDFLERTKNNHTKPTLR